MNIVLPSTVEDINRLQQNYEFTNSKDALGYNKGFENIYVEKRFKREVSLPDGIKNWNIDNIQPYLNFEEDNYGGFKAIESAEVVQVVPEEDNSRLRCDSFSSLTSTMDDRMFFQGMGVKTINTICVDSGSTCISAADHSFLNSPDSIYRTMDPEETYQNLEVFLQQVPEVSENLPSPLSISGSDSSFDMPVLSGSYFLPTCTQDSFTEAPRGTKRPASTSSDVDMFGLRTAKQPCPSPPPVRYNEVRKKNNIASKNCRKTRKERQKEKEQEAVDLEKENQGLRIQVQVLEEEIKVHQKHLFAVLKRR